MPSPRNSVRITTSPTAKSTPRRRLQTRVSITGSPAQRRRGMVLQDVEVNALPPTTAANTQTAGENSHPNPSSSPSRKRSALKSPNSPRKGHRRQNCVRISTLPPMVLGEEVSGHCLLDGILEESPEDPVATRVSMICISAPAEKMSLRPTLSPRSHTDPVKWRASLTPSSPTLSLLRFEQESWSQRGARSIMPKVACAALPRDVSADLLSIPSFHSFNSQFEFSEAIRREIPTPTFELTRPSGEYDDERKGFLFELDFDESPVQPRTFDETQMSWSAAELDDFDKYSAKLPGEHDGWPESALRMTNITIATSSSSSSLDFPFADGGDPVICSDPLDAQSALLPRNEQPEPLPRAASFRFRSPLQPSSQQTPQSSFSPKLPATPNWSPLFSHPPPQSPSQSSLTHFPPLSPSPSTTSIPSGAYPFPLRPVTFHKRVSGPRSAPTRDLRRSIMQLRRMNSDLRSAGFNTPQARRYTKLGREASPVLPFGFGGFPVFEDGEGDGEDGEDWEGFREFGGEEGRENELPGGMGVEEGFGERRIRKGKRGEEVGEEGAWDNGEGRAERGRRGSRSVLRSVHFCGDGELL
ncbi:hypothetical protein C1H76_0947 [Elsinoe australis]|uniref:Uncharacterized protein n=1 Tax=Elsinoe australis TaxID=40998 RepID=A0A4U7B5X0_9PEZI|nr:hypothetical protein C1H76_0947 [Elsinoe australis]